MMTRLPKTPPKNGIFYKVVTDGTLHFWLTYHFVNAKLVAVTTLRGN